jgi:hypothetical protein
MNTSIGILSKRLAVGRLGQEDWIDRIGAWYLSPEYVRFDGSSDESHIDRGVYTNANGNALIGLE